MKLIAAARAYASRGWYIFPLHEFSATTGCACGIADCDKPGKHPAVAWGEAASIDRAVIDDWWTANPLRGIGMVTGEKSGLSVLDIDGDEGLISLSAIEGSGGGLPATPCVESRPSHRHYYFKFDARITSQQSELGPKLDTRSNGGYVVAPPSPHVSGGRYKWIKAPEDCELADWPEWLLPASARKPKKKKAAADGSTRETFNPANPVEVQMLQQALAFLDNDDEAEWASVGWILGRAFRQSDAGYVIYWAWAGASAKANAKSSRYQYYEYSKKPFSGEVKTVGSIFKRATEEGWIYEDGKHIIMVKEGQLDIQVDDAIAALVSAGETYTRSGRLVQVIKVHELQHEGIMLNGDKEVHRDAYAPVIHEYDSDSISVRLDSIARFERAGKIISCPKAIASGLLSLGQWKGIPPIHSITGSPFLRRDGTVCDTAGFDRESGTMLFVNGLRLIKVADKPTRKAALAALEHVRAPFSEVPWRSAMYESSFYAFILTLLTRPIIPAVPAFIFSAPKPGNGKTLLADCASVIVHGTMPAKRSYMPDQEEQRKVLQALMLSGDPMILFDNVKQGTAIGGDVLSMYITSEYVGDRTLGHSEARRISNSSCMAFTGNNIGASADIVRRTLAVEIDAGVEHPERRSFKIPNLPGYLRANRAEMLHNLLTILRAFIVAGAPIPEHGVVGSFEHWDRIVSGPLMWLGLPDPMDTQAELHDEDIGMEVVRVLFEELLRMQPDKEWFTVEDVRRHLGVTTLAQAIHGACESIDNLGYWLRSQKGVIIGNMRLTKDVKLELITRISKWKIESLTAR